MPSTCTYTAAGTHAVICAGLLKECSRRVELGQVLQQLTSQCHEVVTAAGAQSSWANVQVRWVHH